LKVKAILSGLIVLIVFLGSTGTAYAQAVNGRYTLNLGIAYTQATTTNARTGFLGFDIFAGKMLTNNICVGFAVGHDIVSYRQLGDFHERLAIIPFQIKTKYYMSLSTMVQAFATVGGGVYRALPHLNPEPIGDISYATNQPGGSIGFGVDYWFLLMQGVGFEFEYHFFNTDKDNLFSYFALRVSYGMLKF
jgi:hypothetical protein